MPWHLPQKHSALLKLLRTLFSLLGWLTPRSQKPCRRFQVLLPLVKFSK